MLQLRWRSLFRRSLAETELDAELEFHIQKQIEENLTAGMSAREARRMAVRQFGGLQQRTEECRDARRVHTIEDLLRDLAYATRTLRKSPGFTTVAILSLALGIGANTAIFSLINPMLLRPLNVPQPARLVRVLSGTKGGEPPQDVSYPNYVEIRKSAQSMQSLAASSWPVQIGLGASAGARSERAFASMVSGNYFSTIGVRAALGRTFLPAEDRTRGDHPVVVLSHDLWKQRFGSDPNLPGKAILLGGRPFDVIGVMPADMP
ncbi:MAG: ABC transporter permease, partial [Bryobacteraceae bacterium]